MTTRIAKYGFILALALASTPWRAVAQSDVTQPGDTIFASSSNSPGSEGVANAIDNTQAKYLNFDTSTGHTPPNAPSGFAVTPSVGITRVVGISIESANDSPERDPSTFTLEGSNDDALTSYSSGTWEFIAGFTNITAFTNRFQTQTFLFDNFKAYKHYRWTVTEVATPNGCCMQVAEVDLLGATLPPDVTQPGDPIVASSSNSPGSEGVANAIDNTQAKYLNFDTSTGHTPPNAPSGFAVTPSIGSSLVTGISVTSANDSPERDPSTFTLEGSNDAVLDYAAGNWTFIAGFTNITAFTNRFETQTFLFDNYTPFKNYRWVVQAVATPNGCCMQVAEVELLGTSAPKDVTQPGDPIVASSSNSPGSEGVANAIDNTQAKYLNFDTSTGHTPPNAPSGFAVAPSVGATAVIGLAITSANDSPERDPSTFTLEGSNDAGLDYATNNWVFIAGFTNITAFTNRFQTQEFYFANKQSFKNYRWVVEEVATPNGCCMQVAEVDLLAATQSNPCGQTAFIDQPVNTPALAGTPATFFTKVNGPWTLQWYKNGTAIPGATQTSYSTPPVDASIITNDYSVAIVGCQTSQVVRASIFATSTTKSIAVSFIGGGANGAPTSMFTNDIVGVQAQAYWNNATNASGTPADGVTLPDVLTDSDGNAATITFEFSTANTWGAGTGTDKPTERMLNGLTGRAGTGDPATYTFHNVPAGSSNAVLIYAVSPPLQFQTVSYAITTGTPATTYYLRVMNSDEYKPAPGFYRGSSTVASSPTVANFVRFDGIQPDAAGDITVSVTTLVGAAQSTGVNGIQLVLNAPNPGSPPVITANPQPTVAPLGGTASLSVTATGSGLTYQWRKNGVNISNGGNISGVTSSNLTINSFTNANEGVYSVAVFNPAGSVVSKNASVRVSQYNISDALVGYWRFDETSGTVAANSAAGGQVAVVNGTPSWVAGQITNAFSFDGAATYLFVTNYTKATIGVSASGWVNVNPAIAAGVNFIRNGDGALRAAQVGQFEIGLAQDAVDPTIYRLQASIMTGPNTVTATAPNAFPLGSWQQVAFSADGAQLRLYINGAEVASTDYLGPIAPPGTPYLSIGAVLSTDVTDPLNPILGPDATPNFMSGPIDDLGLWTRNLTGEEVSKIYQQGQLHLPLTSVVLTPPPTRPTVSLPTLSGGNVTITWSGGGTLYSGPAATGPWATTGNATGTFSEPASGAGKYYQVIK